MGSSIKSACKLVVDPNNDFNRVHRRRLGPTKLD